MTRQVRPSVPDPPELERRLWDGFGGSYGWDVGANCGQTVPVMSRLFGRFTSFEPCEDSCAYARERHPAADIRQLAVSDHDGTAELAFPAAEQYQTGQLVTIGTKGMEWEPSDWDAVPHVKVPCRSADSLAAELGTPDFAKVDTEGHEHLVLRGARQLLAAGRTDFLIECHGAGNFRYCLARLEKSGYRAEVVRHPHYPPGTLMWSRHGWIRAFAPHRQEGTD
jgi:FkbM family methyltransferase